jgi:hypothetical protein
MNNLFYLKPKLGELGMSEKKMELPQMKMKKIDRSKKLVKLTHIVP